MQIRCFIDLWYEMFPGYDRFRLQTPDFFETGRDPSSSVESWELGNSRRCDSNSLSWVVFRDLRIELSTGRMIYEPRTQSSEKKRAEGRCHVSPRRQTFWHNTTCSHSNSLIIVSVLTIDFLEKPNRPLCLTFQSFNKQPKRFSFEMKPFSVIQVLFFLSSTYAFSSTGRVFVSTPVSNFQKKHVADCMSAPSVVLRPDQSLDDAMSMLLRNGISGAPVLDDEGKVVGMVTSMDFLQKEALEGSLLPMGGSREQVQSYVDAARKICAQRVNDVMSPLVVSVSPKHTMQQASLLMTEHQFTRVPVLDENEKLVGILSASAVMEDLLHIVKNLPPAKELVAWFIKKDSMEFSVSNYILGSKQIVLEKLS